MASNQRRHFLKIAAASSMLGLGMLAAYKQATDRDIVVAILKRRMAPFDLSDDVFADFADHYVRHRRDFSRQLKLLGTVSWFFRSASPYEYLPMKNKLRRLEDNIVSNFMLSTDYFAHEGLGGQKTKYIGWYDPYTSPCRANIKSDA